MGGNSADVLNWKLIGSSCLFSETNNILIMDTKSIGVKHARFMLNKSKTVSKTFIHPDSSLLLNPFHWNSSSLSQLPIINLQNVPGKKR